MADKKLTTEDKRLLLVDWIVNLDKGSIDELFEQYIETYP